MHHRIEPPLFSFSSSFAARSLFAVALFGLQACGAAPADHESAASESAAVMGGVAVVNDTLGTVEVQTCVSGPLTGCTSLALCAGNMIADRWLVTAASCVSYSADPLVVPPAPFPLSQMRVQNQNGSSAAGVAQVVLHPSLDVALVQLTGSVSDSAGAVVSSPLFAGASTSLVGGSVYCQGFGGTTAYGAGPAALSGALLPVTAAAVGQLVLAPSATGAYLWTGDRGAVCFLTAPGGARNAIVGIFSRADVNGARDGGVVVKDDQVAGSDGFASWVPGALGAATCAAAGATCGGISDALGVIYSCGTCDPGSSCQSGTCVQITSACDGPHPNRRLCCLESGGYWVNNSCQ